MPIGVPMNTARTVRIRLPTMGLSSPPSEPGGGVISVKTASESPLNPSHKSTTRITISQPSPSSVAASERLSMMPLRRRRAAGRLRFMASSDPALDAQQHVACDREHDEGNDEEDQAQRDQRGGIEIPDRFGEFVGDGGRNGGAGRQQGG